MRLSELEPGAGNLLILAPGLSWHAGNKCRIVLGLCAGWRIIGVFNERLTIDPFNPWLGRFL